MEKFYSNGIIPEILKIFKAKEIVVSGVTNENIIKDIFRYDAQFSLININGYEDIEGNPLEILPNLENYDVIFIDDDANWFTVYNELNIIKKNNEIFPLVFICNNNFPNKRRDSYLNPDKIPSNFRHEYSSDLPVCCNNEKIVINDGFYHACDENTPKNGVFTAIEDFLDENSHIGLMKINFIKEISILYLKTPINQKRISIINRNIQNKEINSINLSDKLIENQLLVSYINKYNLTDGNLNNLEVLLSKKNAAIEDFKYEIKSKDDEISFKDTQLNGFESKLSLKESQIKNIESKLINKDYKINNLKNEIGIVKSELNSLNQKLNDKNQKFFELMEEFKQKESDYANQIDFLVDDFNQKEVNYVNEINSLNNVFDQKEVNYVNEINSLNNVFDQKEANYLNEINSLSNEVNITNQNLKNSKENYENEISIKDNQINSLKNDLTQNENYFSKKEMEFNNQITSKNLDIKQKENQIQIKQAELDKKEKKLHNLQECYTKQLNKLDTNEYCISCFKDEISNNQLEIRYLKSNAIIKKILSPFAYLYLIFNSNLYEISLNIKLYRLLKNSRCFDIGFYLNRNKDLLESNWCKYFSPELHYVCNGFDEKRIFNKKYFNRKSKKDLLEYLLSCDK